MNNKKPISKIVWNDTILQLEKDEVMSYRTSNVNVIQRIRNACTELKKKGYEFTTSIPEDGNSILIKRIK